jgi:Plasma-membrane choline transporter
MSASLNGIVAPLVMVWLLAYFVSVMFFEILSMAIETILCCYIADEEMVRVARVCVRVLVDVHILLSLIF